MASKKRKLGTGEVRQSSPGSVWGVVVAAVFSTRYLVPTESVEVGHTLWIAAAWLGLAAVRSWRNWRLNLPVEWKLGPADFAIMALVLGHCASGGMVLSGLGDRRAALNFFWEWLSLGAAWCILRDALQSVQMRRLLTNSFLITVLMLSSLGLWQHLYWYPQQSRETSELLELGKKLDRGQSMSALERQHFEQLIRRYGTDVLTADESSRQLMIDRAQHSVEPIGRFALANSFAALLAAGLLMSVDLFLRTLSTRGNIRRQVILVGGIVLLGTCLLLTKSRTAYVGTALGLAWLIGVQLLRSSRRTLLLAWSGVALLMFLVMVTGLWLTGGLDMQVIQEARQKSLAYRWEYWQTTLQMIWQHPLAGVGLGNFRQHYLAFKPPGASEEIVDPHNLVLEAWANGGILGLFGVLSFIGIWLGRLWKPGRETAPFEDSSAGGLRPLLLAGGLSVLLVLLQEFFLQGFLDNQLVLLCGVWIAFAILFQWGTLLGSPGELGVLAAGAAVLIHLTGAGGIGMPAIVQLLMVLTIISSPQPQVSVASQTSHTHSTSTMPLAVAAVASAAAMFACVWTGLVPVTSSTLMLDTGRYQLIASGRMGAAQSAFRDAIEADPLAPEPRQELAMAEYLEWQKSGRQRDEFFEQAVELQQQAINRDRFAAKRYLRLAEWWMERFQRSKNRQHIQEAIQLCQQAVPLYPNYPPLRAQLALALMAAGQPGARDEARIAIRLDDLNRQRGHMDKILPASVRSELDWIAVLKN